MKTASLAINLKWTASAGTAQMRRLNLTVSSDSEPHRSRLCFGCRTGKPIAFEPSDIPREEV